MVEKVGGWRASDGEIYPTKAAAREAENNLALGNALEGLDPENSETVDRLIEALKPFRTPIKRASRKRKLADAA